MTTTTTVPQTGASEDLSWLSNLNDPTKLTPEQRVRCGIDAEFTCNSGDSKRRKKCRNAAVANGAERRQKCEQLAAIPPPPVFSDYAPPGTNPYGSPGGAEASVDARLAELAAAVAELRGGVGPVEGIPADPYAAPGDDFTPFAQVSRLRTAYSGAVSEEGMSTTTVLLLAGAAALLGWWVLR